MKMLVLAAFVPTIKSAMSSVNTTKLLLTLSAKNVVSYPICIGYTWTRKEYTAVALFTR